MTIVAASVILKSKNPNKNLSEIVIIMYMGTDKRKLESKVAALAGGDARAFDYIYEHTNRAVYFAILYIVGNKHDAEDLLQDTYVRALRSLGAYREDNFTGWLVQMGKNLALNHVKRAKREVATDFAEQSWRFGAKEEPLPYVYDVAAKALTEEEYRIVMMCSVAGYKRREVAAMLNMPIGTVTWKYNEALKKLRVKLNKEDI